MNLVQNHNNIKFIIGLAPPRRDNPQSAFIQSMINHNIYGFLWGQVGIVTVNDFEMEGKLDESMYNNDKLHLNKAGTSVLASRFKKAIHHVLGL